MKDRDTSALIVFTLSVALVYVLARISLPDAIQQESPSVAAVVPETPPPPTINPGRLYEALVEQESGGNPHAVGDGGRAIGVLQIHPIMVRDVNRILGYDRWTLEDRWSAAESRAMLEVYLGHYGATSYEEAARKWNGGPGGHLKASTVPYWEKVREALEKS